MSDASAHAAHAANTEPAPALPDRFAALAAPLNCAKKDSTGNPLPAPPGSCATNVLSFLTLAELFYIQVRASLSTAL